MRYLRTTLFFVSLFTLASRDLAAAPGTIVEQLSFDTNAAAPLVKPVKIKASLYLPRKASPVAAMVIISGSGGVNDWTELYYARELARNGIAALVVDSFGPRGVRSTVQDQTLVTYWEMENDAFAALAMLRKDKRIDPAHIGIMGQSKGGLIAQNAAFTVRQNWRRTGALAFDVHVPITSDCAVQHRTVLTTGKPIFFMFAELDDYDLVKPCLDYIKRIRVAGNTQVVEKIYKGAHHNWEDVIHPVTYLARAENYSKCDAILEDSGEWVMAGGKGPTLSKPEDKSAWLRKNCMTLGAHVAGGTEKLKSEATGDLIAFLKQHGF
jgi:dienelactone hydrolase